MAKKPEPESRRPAGRPRVELTPDQMFKLSSLHMTQEEIAAFCGCSERTILRRITDEPEFKEAWEQGKANGRASLRRLQFEHAKRQDGSGVRMCIHLSEHWLGETPKAALAVSGRIDSSVEVTVRDRLAAKFDTLSKRFESGVASIAEQAGAQRIPSDAE